MGPGHLTGHLTGKDRRKDEGAGRHTAMTDLAGDHWPHSRASELGEDSLSAADGAVLQPLAEELLAIAARLRRAAALAGAPPLPAAAARSAASAPSSLLALARKIYALRRKRAAIFGEADLFGEPAWDILLDLYIAHGEGKPVSVSSACIGSAAPSTTGLRWLGVLVDVGLVLREHDPADQRRVLVRLSDQGKAAMERFLAAAAAALG